ncbi:PAS domain S-box protein [Sphingomonas corticis]|uniref:histidine kinase n=1 Tax=Sphingomonas corticis TaxID=2722791 RepID=A0ABX1CGH0_9SPHN|nr:PAS domain S-box protein [Sphingomonas corticis]NJR77113.1 PAS domain S-box protein [Sphingomonas corticis]
MRRLLQRVRSPLPQADRAPAPTGAELPTDEALTLLIDGAMNYAIYMLDPAGRVAIWNRGAQRIKGWCEREIVGRSSDLFYLPQDVAAGKPARDLARATALGRFEEETWRMRKDGSSFLANVTITALRGPGGELRGFGKVVRDITEQRVAQAAIEQRESQLAAVLATVPDAMILVDAAWRIASFSRTAERLFGHAEGDVVGRHVGVLLQPEAGTDLFEAATPPLVGRRVLGRRSDGATFACELAIDRMGTGGASSFIIFMRDLTERERTLGELDDLRSKLAQAARASVLGVMGSALAHELNQPIAAAINYAEASRDLLARQAGAGPIDEALAGVVQETLRAGGIVRQLRNFVARGELDRLPCDLAAVVGESCRMLADMLEQRGVTLRLDLGHGGEAVLIERIQIHQVLVNLMRNAVEAMADAEPRVLSIATRRQGAMVEVRVEDTGPGIAADVADTLFLPFTTGKADGMGIGLSICRTIVEVHGGAIAATRRDGKTRVGFTLPIAHPAHDRA